MKRVVSAVSVLFAVLLLTAGAQAEQAGEAIFNKKCLMCHVVKGKGGAIGPELTRIASKMKDKDLREKIENPKKSNGSSTMPGFKTLPKADMDALIGYMKTLK